MIKYTHVDHSNELPKSVKIVSKKNIDEGRKKKSFENMLKKLFCWYENIKKNYTLMKKVLLFLYTKIFDNNTEWKQTIKKKL